VQDALSDLIGYPIDYYVKVNFEGFKQIVDLIGGVDINVPTEIYDDKYPDDNFGYESPLHFLPGVQHMDGTTALKYARTRHGDNDYMRAARQQQVIMAIKDKITQPGQMSALLPRLPGLTIAMANSVQTDMPVDKAIAMARQLDKVDLQNVSRVVIDQKMGTVTPNDPELGYILTPDLNKLRAAASAVFADAAVGPSPEEVARQAVQSEAARVIVLNGTPEKGLAAKTQATLITNGFNVVTVGNADNVDYETTQLVTHGDATPATVEALVRWFKIPSDRIRSEPPSDQVDVTLIIGADQAGTAATP
jgi:anionic cell wall polymer biosynthesis LytR-Cps2A-Psr (LCP) family protein